LEGRKAFERLDVRTIKRQIKKNGEAQKAEIKIKREKN